MTTTTEPEQTAESELRALAQSIETYRADLGLPEAALLRQYPELGTDKTYGKITSGDFAELKIEDKWLPAWKHVWQQIEGDDHAHDAGLIADLTGPRELCRSFLDAQGTRQQSLHPDPG